MLTVLNAFPLCDDEHIKDSELHITYQAAYLTVALNKTSKLHMFIIHSAVHKIFGKQNAEVNVR